jgi:hypothetical protein
MTLNPFDPFNLYATWSSAAERTAEQMKEAQRQLKLTAARADVDASYLAFRNNSDRTSAENLAKAVTGYLEVS